MKKRLSCKRIEGAAFIGQSAISPCCYRAVPPLASGFFGGQLPEREILEARARLRRALDAGEPCICSHCSFLEYKAWPDDDEKHLFTDSVHVSNHHYFCNLACTYCSQAASQSLSAKPSYNFLPVAQEMISKNYLSPASVIHFGSGEPTTMPEFADLLNLIAKKTNNRVQVVSNGTVFSAELAGLLKAGRAKLVVSPDAASREVYAKIKGYNLFDRVVENLLKYGSSGVALKYIVLPENSAEGDGGIFLDLAERLGIQEIQLSTDYIRLPVSPAELDRYAEMEALARKRGFTVYNFVHEEVEMHHYFDFCREREGRRALHAAGRELEDAYRVPAWNEILCADTVFIRELHYLLTGAFPGQPTLAAMETALRAAPSRFHYAAVCHDLYYVAQGAWGRRALSWPQLWRLYLLVLGRAPAADELALWRGEALSLDSALYLLLEGDEFKAALRMAESGKSCISRRDVFLLYALLLGNYPASERELLQAQKVASLSRLATSIRFSGKFDRLALDAKPSRYMPLAFTKLTALDAERIQAVFPGWLAEPVPAYVNHTLLEYWKKVVSQGIPASLVSAKKTGGRITKKRLSVLWFGTGEMTSNLLPLLYSSRFSIAAYIDETREAGAKFMERPVITSVSDIARWEYDYILVGARPFGAIKNKLLGAGAQADKIICLDFEAGAYDVASMRGSLESCLQADISANPVLGNALNLNALMGTDWFARMRQHWDIRLIFHAHKLRQT